MTGQLILGGLVGFCLVGADGPNEKDPTVVYSIRIEPCQGSGPVTTIDLRGFFVVGAPCFSRDGQWIAFDGYKGHLKNLRMRNHDYSSADSPFDGYKGNLKNLRGECWIAKSDGSVLRKLTSGEAPRWSPDGEQLLFMREPDDQARQGVGIFLIRRDGSGERRLCDGRWPDWSPDGKRMVFSVGGRGDRHSPKQGTRVCISNLDGTEREEIADGDCPSWSPDGNKIACCYRDPAMSGPLVRLINLGSERQFFVGYGFYRANWSADSTSVYANGASEVGRGMVRIPVAVPGKAVPILPDTTSDSPCVSADGKRIVFVVHGNRREAAPSADHLAPPNAEARAAEPTLLTPRPPAEPRINGARVYGVRPGSPFLFRIPATGQRPMTFAADGLPETITLDRATGILSGRIASPGVRRVTLRAKNARGETTREFRIVVGDRLALTPPMGWDSWFSHYYRVSDKVMRRAAERMIASGMADYGYQYVHIGDCWAKRWGDPPYRDAQGDLLTNVNFPDMKGLADFIHAKGLKAALYSSPGPWTPAAYVGAYGHEAADARKYGEWGFDFLKYGWSGYYQQVAGRISGVEDIKRPYKLMWDELQKLHRDIVFNVCVYGFGDVWTWGAEMGNCWRTTFGDMDMTGGSEAPGFLKIGLSNAQHWKYARPGAWNDSDLILIGWVGDRPSMGVSRPTAWTPDEQYTYMSLWCLMASPLTFGGDMDHLDPLTLNVLCNAEVIEVDQDPLGKQARIVRQSRRELVMTKEMEDGSRAVGLFNLGGGPSKISASWEELGIFGKQRVRDLWRQKDLGTVENLLEAQVPRHGVAMLRLSAAP